jgi:hypothetical protein
MSLISKYFDSELPGEWRDQTVYTFMGPDDSGVQHIMTLVVDSETGGLELEDFAQERIDAVMNAIQGAEVLKSELKQLPNGRTVYEFVYKWVPVDNKIILQKVVYLIIDDIGYTFSANFSKKTLKTIGHEVEQIINSFRPAEIEDNE